MTQTLDKVKRDLQDDGVWRSELNVAFPKWREGDSIVDMVSKQMNKL